MKRYIALSGSLALAIGAHADIVQLNTGKILSCRVVAFANDAFELQPTNAAPVAVPANMVASIDFSKGVVLATVELAGQKPLAGKIWLYARGAMNFQDDKGETTRIPLAKISRVAFSADSIPEKPAPPPRPKPVRAQPDSARSQAESSANATKIETITHGDQVNIQDHCVRGKITIVDFYADWCGPCMTLGPPLEAKVNKDDDLILRKVDIVKWNSPVCQQYGIRSLPHLEVYDRRGNKVGEMNGFDGDTFESYLAKARQ